VDNRNNLDTLAAQVAQETVRDWVLRGEQDAKKKVAELDNMATKALGVLQEQGVYAGMLYLFSSDDACARKLREELLEAFNRPEMQPFDLILPSNRDKLEWLDVSEHLIERVCDDLDTLLLVKQVWEQTLIYVRYGAKAYKE
jgi:hypothetical protein